jgi:amino acid transporter
MAAQALRRALGLWDLTFLTVVAVANLNVVPVIAANGPKTVWLWLAALAFFFLPQGIAVIELSRQMPGEGGIYVWTKGCFGEFHGFLCGWCYWTSNIFYIPTLLFYLSGYLVFAGGTRVAALIDNRPFFFALITGFLWITIYANIRGISVGKWISNAGAVGTLVTAAVLISLGLANGVRIPASSFTMVAADWQVMSVFGIVCFGLVGLELGPIMADEVRDAARTLPRSVVLGGLLSGGLYLGATLTLILAVPKEQMSLLQGALQAIQKLAGGFGWGWIVSPLAALLVVAIAGTVSAWVGGAARIMFVSGIDRFLPPFLGRIHPIYATPHMALLGFGVLATAIIAMSFARATVKEAYLTLLDLAVVLQMIAYLYMFAALFRLGRGAIRFAAVSGFITTAIGTVVAFVPSRQISSVLAFELKMFITCALFLALAAGLFRYYSRRRASVAVPV